MPSDITKLPKELLALIFEHLTEANDRRRAAQTCKLFYDIIRHQSTLKRDNTLRMTGSDLDASPIRVLENSAFFPFSKLFINNWHRHIILESAFWSLHGPKISEIMFNDQNFQKGNVLPILKEYFPNLKKLTIECEFAKPPDADNSENISVSLPISDLNIDIRLISFDQALSLLHCSPLLKNVEIKWLDANYLPQILPWLETIENSRLFLYEEPLDKLINLPSKVVIGELTIKVNETKESIRTFFQRPRTIETLILHTIDLNDNFGEDGGENLDNPIPIYFNREQVLALGAAKSIKNIHLPRGALKFEGSLDLLAELPGLESISLNTHSCLRNPLYPFYWSTPETALKVREIDYMGATNLDHLSGLSSVTSLTVFNMLDSAPRGLSGDNVQTMIRNCPNLKKLFVPGIEANDADLIGHGDLLPFSSLEKLESLDIGVAPNITSKAFKSAFKFPNLKDFSLLSYNSSEELPFTEDVAKHFTQNCPNLEHLTIFNCHITEEAFNILIRNLHYLRDITIGTKRGHSLNKGKVEEMQKEFPYMRIRYSPDIDIL